MIEILIVDYSPEIRAFMGECVEMMGMRATVAASAGEALRRLASQPVDLVISDLAMPGIDGWGLIDRLRGVHPGVPVVLMSGWDVDRRLARARGAAGWLSKPFGYRAMKEAIRPWVALEEELV